MAQNLEKYGVTIYIYFYFFNLNTTDQVLLNCTHPLTLQHLTLRSLTVKCMFVSCVLPLKRGPL